LKKVVIIGGGLAGLISAIRLARAGITCKVIEKKAYPFHRVCGEYISNEALPFLKRENLYPHQIKLPVISEFLLSAVNGNSKKLSLDTGGVGISRYALDNFLCGLAVAEGVEVIQRQEVDRVIFEEKNNQFDVITGHQGITCDIVIGSFGKRSTLDRTLDRGFMKKQSPYVGVKYHLRTNHPESLIALHNFRGGYCGISNIEEGQSNLCYLVHRSQVKRFRNIKQLEEAVLFENPFLKTIFRNAEFLFDKPETINEISFETKEPVWQHILMAGDAAGMIAPLCGNGMAMAIHSGKIVSDLIIRASNENKSRKWLEENYALEWRKTFSNRLRIGRLIQNHLFGSVWSSNLAIALAIHSKSLARFIIRNTHGKPF
jgi:menaquinone-9 beta-reductase